MLLTFGKPNFVERRFIQKCIKAGEPFPAKKIQLQFRAQITSRAKGLSMRPRHLALLGALALPTCGTLVPAAEYPAPDMSEWYSFLMIPDAAYPEICCGEADAYWADDTQVALS